MSRPDVPMYARIERDLREAIGSGTLPLGARVPSEEELCRTYAVSRMTARQALSRLADAGLLVRRRGIGTFVAQTKVARVAGRLLGFQEDALAHGLDPSTQVLQRREEAAGPGDAALLGCDPEATVLRVERLRLHGDRPIGLNQVVVAPTWVTAFADLDFAGSFYQGAERLLGDEVAVADTTIESVAADDEAAARLGVEPGAPMLYSTRVNRLASGRLLGLTRSLYRGDAYFLSLTVRKDAPDLSDASVLDAPSPSVPHRPPRS